MKNKFKKTHRVVYQARISGSDYLQNKTKTHRVVCLTRIPGSVLTVSIFVKGSYFYINEEH